MQGKCQDDTPHAPSIDTERLRIYENPKPVKVDDSKDKVQFTVPEKTPTADRPVPVLVSTKESTVLSSDRFTKDFTVTEESYLDAAENPQQKAAVNSVSQTAGCSDIVRPLPRLIPKITDIWWLVDIYGILKSLLDPDSGYRNRHNTIVQQVHQRIDLNELLPSSEEDFSQWQTYAGARNS